MISPRLATLALALLFPAAAPMTVWVIDPLTRVRPKDAPGTATEAKIKAARNEYEAFQVVVRAGAGGLKGVTVAVSDLQAEGRVLERKHIALFLEHYVEVKTPTPKSKEGPGFSPDALIPFPAPAAKAPAKPARVAAWPFA